MPRTSKGARLVWRDESRKSDGSLRSRAGWFIRDGQSFIVACGGTGDLERAQKALAEHTIRKYEPARERGRHPDQVTIADAVNLYAREIVPAHAKPAETAARLATILSWFGELTLGDINGGLCRDYAAAHGDGAAARRQLEDLRAALNHCHREGYVTAAPAIVLPPKPQARKRWLTRDEAAALLRAAWRMKQSWKGQPSDRRTGRHVARFILVALYTGTRSGAICNAALRPTPGRGHVDLESGIFYRRADGVRQTKKRQPPVRIPERLLAHIRRWAETDRHNDGRPGRIADNFVVEWNGRPVRSIRKAFATARQAAGLGPDVTPHVFRHTAATWLMQQGADVWRAADFLGMTVDVLIDTYGHHHPDYQAEAAEAITSKKRTPRAPKKIVRMAEKRKANEA